LLWGKVKSGFERTGFYAAMVLMVSKVGSQFFSNAYRQ
jgi:hypothetical protein